MEKTRESRCVLFQRITCLFIVSILICGSGLFGGSAKADAKYTCEYTLDNAAAPTSKGVSSKPDPQRHAEAFVQKALSYQGKTQKEMGFTIAWCAAFVGRCAKETGIPDSVVPNNIPTVSTFFDTMVKRGYKAYKVSDLKSGNYKPEVGDLVFEDTYKKLGHIAIISKVNEDGTFETIDGNVTPWEEESQVMRLLFGSDGTPLNTTGKINSFIRPDYASIDKK